MSVPDLTRTRDPEMPRSSDTRLIAVAAFCCLVVALQQTLVVPAVPQFPRLLDTSTGLTSWLVTATLLTGAVTTAIFGRLSDLFSKRRIMIIAMTFVLAGSVLAPLGGIETLIAGRAMQGVGTALVPVAMAQMKDILPGRRVGGALAVLSSTLGVGGSIGIPLGGVMLSALGWESMFWLSAALSVASIALIAVVLPRSRPSDDSGSFDLTGAILLSVALPALLIGLSQGSTWGWGSATTLTTFAVGIVVTLGWGFLELRRTSPIVDLRTSASRPLLFTNLASLVLGILMFTNLLLTTLRLQGSEAEDGFSWSASSAGLAMIPTALVMFAVAPLSAGIAQRFGPRSVLTIGAAVTAVGYSLGLVASLNAPLAIVWTTVISAGVGIGYAALPMLVVRYAPDREIGSANGVNALLRAIGTAIASALVAALTAAMAPSGGARGGSSAEALTTIGSIGFALGAATIVLATLARASNEAPSKALPERA
ncbi:MFS transporter [Streptomyces sp. LHD-70]|uniref:MFS transporter n=1 Tax=Streptomyces sp. LHD-70 TaxID=3072140 RepID=UPI00280C7FF7|nr:MFS transporter [Streptomyces sp. LHD-70]MDQ8705414.1 MFS transporter [Streptomyces sp. LHD-70]